MLHDQINNLIVILLFGTLVMLAFVHFANPLKVNKKGNRWFGVFLLLYASFWLEEIAVFIGIGEIGTVATKMIRMSQICTPALLYLSVVLYAAPQIKIRVKHLWHVVVPVVYVIVLLNNGRLVWLVVMMLLQGLLYTVLSYLKIKHHQRKILIYSSNTQGIELKWLEYIVVQIFILFVVVIAHNVFFGTADLNAFMNGIQLVTGFVMMYFSWRQKEIYPVGEEKREELQFVDTEGEPSQKKKKLIADNELEALKERLSDLMTIEKPYLDSELNLVKLAESMQVSPHQLSYIINAGFNENFYQFVNRFRVEKAKELLRDAGENHTMLAVAFGAGFNSKTAFNTTFKKLTGQTPSEFRKTG